MYLCNHIHNLNRAKSSTVRFNLIKKVFLERWYNIHVYGHMVVRSDNLKST